jgi:CO/xanthine dehydrogenase Mo-binding subunit
MIRSDALTKIDGRAEYGMDLEALGMLWAALVPSPVAHGRIRSVDLSAARRAPGVRVAIGPKEVAKLLPNGGGDPERPLFPTAEVRYRNQPLAAIAASSLAEAREAARLAKLTIEPLPSVPEIESLFPDWPDAEARRSPHVIAHVQARSGDLEGAFDRADFVHSETYRTSAISQVALEPHACLAEVEDGHWRVRTSTQTPFGVREDAASILGIPEESLVVDGTWVGGGFGGKGAAFLEPYALVLAAAAHRPVKLALTYREEFLLGRSTLPSVIRLDTSVRQGRMTGRRVRLLLDTGASLPGRDFATGYAIGFLLGPYKSPAFEVEGYAVRTNKPPFGPHRAPFAPQCAFALESHLDGIARRLAVDPIAFRRSHVWKEGDSTHYGQTVGPFGLDGCLAAAQKLATDWRRKLPPNHGLGIGCGFWSTGTSMGGEAELHLFADRLVIAQGEREIGSGSVIRGLVAVAERVLGLPAERVEVEYHDTSSAPFDTGVFGSRTVGALGQAVEKASRTLLTELQRRAKTREAARLAESGGRLVFTSGRRSVPVSDLLTSAERRGGGLTARGKHYGASSAIDENRVVDGTFYPYSDYAGACHLAEVEIDRETGRLTVVRYVAFHDVGTVIDGATLRAQVEGAVIMGLGEALTEEGLWDSEGKLENPSLLDYRVPTLGEAPPVTVIPVEGFRGAGPFGAKGMGEPPIIPVPAAVANAFADATGTRLTELPFTAERVARTLRLL